MYDRHFFPIKIFLFSYKSKINHCIAETEHRVFNMFASVSNDSTLTTRARSEMLYMSQSKRGPFGERNILKDWRLYDSFQIPAILVGRGRTTIHDHDARLCRCCANKIDNTSHPSCRIRTILIARSTPLWLTTSHLIRTRIYQIQTKCLIGHHRGGTKHFFVWRRGGGVGQKA